MFIKNYLVIIPGIILAFVLYTLSQAGDELIKETLRVANGRLTCAEALGHKEFVMTKLYRSA